MKRTLVLLALLFAFASGCGGEDSEQKSGGESESAGNGSGVETTSAGTVELRELTIAASGGKDVPVRVEISDDAAERAQGLMNREKLGEERGMLFVYPSERDMSFWMKNTLIPLSIAYIDSEGRIVDLQDMKALDDEPPHYVSAESAQYALEVNKGFFDERGVEVGDTVELPE